MKIGAREKYNLSWKSLEVIFSMVIYSKTMIQNFSIKNPRTVKLATNLVFVNEKLLVLLGCYVSIGSFKKDNIYHKNDFFSVFKPINERQRRGKL